MAEYIFGNIVFVAGDKGGRFPFCNSLFINDDVRVIVDPGAGRERLTEIARTEHIDMVLNTHYHFDHIAYNYLFKNAKIFINEIEADCYRDRKEIARRLGLLEVYGADWVEGWINRIRQPNTPQSPYSPQNRHEWWLSTARIDGAYQWGELLDFGKTKMQVIGAPGHTEGFSCFYFPNEGVVYVADIDLTLFGPWYFGSDGDIEQFIQSANMIASLDAKFFITGHEAGIVPAPEFRERVQDYLEKIEERHQKMIAVSREHSDLNELVAQGVFYGPKFLCDEFIRAWEEIAVKKHLQKLG
ncbi:MAG: MBL fold metallo-hydrolase [Bacillota bacterium]